MREQLPIYQVCITSIEGDFTINGSQLTDLNDLSGLTSINGNLTIIYNHLLTDISGLQNTDLSNLNFLFVHDNTNLSVCDISSFCSYMQQSNEYYLDYNAAGCDGDSVIASCPAACAEPAGITATNITATKATINWTNSGTFDPEWGTAGFTQGTGTTQNGVEALNYEITGLSGSTSYDVYVRQNCTSNQSAWVKHTFTTNVQCPTGNLIFGTQDEVDNFYTNYPVCTVITGNVSVSPNDSILNFNGLANITSITGDLYIRTAASSTNFNEFNNLTYIGGDVTFFENGTFTTIGGFNSLTEIGGNLEFVFSTNLQTISGFSSLTTIGGNLNLLYSNNLTSVIGLSNLETINGSLHFSYTSLPNISDLSSLASVGQNIIIDINNNLTTIHGTDSLNSVGGDIEFTNNPSLTSITGFNNFTHFAGNIDIHYNTNLNDLSVFSNLVSTGGNLFINSNHNLTSFQGFGSLTSVGGTLSIFDTVLTNLNNLVGITYSGAIRIGFNPYITNFNGFENITQTNGNIDIDYNQTLEDISALQNINSGITSVSITRNSQLSTCNITSICNILNNSAISKNFYDNATGCNNTQEIICPDTCPEPTNIPNFATTATICSGATAPELATTSPNGITGTWSPATVSNTQSGTYTFTPNEGQCATTATLTVTVNEVASPVAPAVEVCTGVNSATLTTSFSVTKTINLGSGLVPAYTDAIYTFNGLIEDIPAGATITSAKLIFNGVTTGSSSYFSAFLSDFRVSVTGQAATLPQTSISNISEVNDGGPYEVTLPSLNNGAFAVTVKNLFYFGHLLISSLELSYSYELPVDINWYDNATEGSVLGTGANYVVTDTSQLNTAGTYTYYAEAINGDCVSGRTPVTLTVNPNITPDFATTATICPEAIAPELATTSPNGISGTWSPATVSNTESRTYTFTPNEGQCATTATFTVTVDAVPPTPQATAVTVCSGVTTATLSATASVTETINLGSATVGEEYMI